MSPRANLVPGTHFNSGFLDSLLNMLDDRIILPDTLPQVTLPFTDVIGCLLGEHPLLEHIVEGMNCAQLQSLLLMKDFSFTHSNDYHAHTHTQQEGTLANI